MFRGPTVEMNIQVPQMILFYFVLASPEHYKTRPDLRSAPSFTAVFTYSPKSKKKGTSITALPARPAASEILILLPAAKPALVLNMPGSHGTTVQLCQRRSSSECAFIALQEDDDDGDWARCLEDMLDLDPNETGDCAAVHDSAPSIVCTTLWIHSWLFPLPGGRLGERGMTCAHSSSHVRKKMKTVNHKEVSIPPEPPAPLPSAMMGDIYRLEQESQQRPLWLCF